MAGVGLQNEQFHLSEWPVLLGLTGFEGMLTPKVNSTVFCGDLILLTILFLRTPSPRLWTSCSLNARFTSNIITIGTIIRAIPQTLPMQRAAA